MDVATLQSWWTLVVLIIFVGIVLWAYSGKRRDSFDAAARMALDEEDGMDKSLEDPHG